MYNLDVTAAVLTETNAKRGSVALDDNGIGPMGVVGGGVPVNFNSIWSFCQNQASGEGVTIIWDGRIPHRDAWASETGRLAAVTLCGPTGRNIRLIGVYAQANPSTNVDMVARVHAELTSLLDAAKQARLTPVVLGDFNDVPEGDLKFALHARTCSTASLTFSPTSIT